MDAFKLYILKSFWCWGYNRASFNSKRLCLSKVTGKFAPVGKWIRSFSLDDRKLNIRFVCAERSWQNRCGLNELLSEIDASMKRVCVLYILSVHNHVIQIRAVMNAFAISEFAKRTQSLHRRACQVSHTAAFVLCFLPALSTGCLIHAHY